MSVTVTANSFSLYSFIDDYSSGPNWLSQKIDQTSTTSQVTTSFTFDNMNVVATFTGSFAGNLADAKSLADIASNLCTSFSIVLNGALGVKYEFSPSIAVQDALSLDSATSSNKLELTYSGNDTFIGSLQANSDGENDWVNGYGGNDVFYGNAASTGKYPDGFLGGDGTDTAVFRGNRAEYSVNATYTTMNGVSGSGILVNDHVTNRDGTLETLSVERLQFADEKIAFDTNGLQTMEFIGLVAPALLNSLPVRGTILGFFDGGNSMEQMCQLALDYDLLPKTSSDLVNTVYHNVVGGTASSDMTSALIDYINANGQVNFLATVAGMHINVDVVGVAQNGMAFS